jgi:hypothetical protein
MKQTAVEWLMKKMDVLDQHSNKSISVCATKELWMDLYNQALAMEKEQIVNALNDGWNMAKHSNFVNSDAEQYYNETFKPNKP